MDVKRFSGQRMTNEQIEAAKADLAKLAQEYPGVSPTTRANVLRFMELLPDGAALDVNPFCVDPDNEVSIDWYHTEPKRILSCSIGDSDRVIWAWLGGKATAHGASCTKAWTEMPADFAARLKTMI